MESQDKQKLAGIVPIVRHGVFRKTNPGWSIGPRTIPDHEWVLVERGKAFICMEGLEYAAEPGMLFYFHPGLVHSLKTDDSDPFTFLAVHFSYSFLQKGNAGWELRPGTEKLPIAAARKLSNPHSFFEALRKTIGYLNEKFPGWELAARSSLESFIYQLLREYPEKDINFGALMKIETAVKHIHDHIERKLDLAVLAEQADVTRDYLSRLFKSYTGYSLIQYIHRCKVQHAKVLLMEGNLKIKDIAGLLGFSDEFHFSKVFKKVEGTSPQFFLKR